MTRTGGRGSSFSRSQGVAAATVPEVQTVVFEDMSRQRDHEALRVEMHQRGDEAEGFVQTSTSWHINEYLRGTFSPPEWERSRFDRIIARMDAGMKPLTRNIKAVRFVDADFLQRFGVNTHSLGTRTADTLNRIFQSASYLDVPQFSSVSTNTNRNVFTHRPVKLNMQITRGTRTIVTNNHWESEIIVDRNTSWKLSNARWNARDRVLEIDVQV